MIAPSNFHPPPSRRKICKNASDRTSNRPSAVTTTMLSGNPALFSAVTILANASPCNDANRNAVPAGSSAKTNRTAPWHNPQCPS